MADEPAGPPEVPEEKPKTFEGYPVLREPSGRVSRRHIADIGETLGSAAEIEALTVKLAEIRAQGKLVGARMQLFKEVNMARTRLMRKRARRSTDKTRLRLIRARTAEKVARTAVDEAAAAVSGAAGVLKGLVEQWTLISSGPLADSLVKDLSNNDTTVRQHAQDSIKEITVAVFDLHKAAQRIRGSVPDSEKIVATWPTEGSKG